MVLPQSAGQTALGPLLPDSYDVVWGLFVAAVLLLTVAALARIVRSQDLTGGARAVWVLLVLLAPPVGAVAALLLVRSGRARTTVKSG